MAGSIRVAGHTIAEHDIVNDKVDIKNATLASSVTFPAGMILQVSSFSTEAEITVSASNPNGTSRILNDGSNNVAVQLTSKKDNPNYTVIYGSGIIMRIDGAGDFYGSAGMGLICNQDTVVSGGNSISANSKFPSNAMNRWNNNGTLTSINYNAYRSLNSADRIIPQNFITEIKNVSTSLSSGSSITFSLWGGFYNNSLVTCINPYITVIEY